MPNPADQPADQVDLDHVVQLLERRNVVAHVEHTGGGTATLFAGPTWPDLYEPGLTRYAAVAGPGSYGFGHRASTAALDDLTVGADVPPEEQDADMLTVAALGCRSDEDVAELIALQVQLADQEDPPTHLPENVLTAHGFDPSGRSTPRDVEQQRAELAAYEKAAGEEDQRLRLAGVADRMELVKAAGDAAVAELRRSQNRL
jgi:hypothetical protein